MNTMIRRIAVGVAALGLPLSAFASTPATSAAPAQKPAVTAKVHKHQKARKVAQAPKAEEKKAESKPAEKAPSTTPAAPARK